jgi:Tfp pilus assembly protein PilO
MNRQLWRRVFVERRSVVLPLLGLLVVNVAVLALVVLPLRRSVTAAEETSIQALADLGVATRDNQAAKLAKSRKEEADVELTKFYAEVLPKNQAEATNLIEFWLDRRARAASLEFRQSQLDVEPVRESRMVKASATVSLRGTYANITRFLYDVETADPFVIVEKVELGESSTLQGASEGIIEIDLDVATYFVGASAPGGR